MFLAHTRLITVEPPLGQQKAQPISPFLAGDGGGGGGSLVVQSRAVIAIASLTLLKNLYDNLQNEKNRQTGRRSCISVHDLIDK